jgi:hypothetical protein
MFADTTEGYPRGERMFASKTGAYRRGAPSMYYPSRSASSGRVFVQKLMLIPSFRYAEIHNCRKYDFRYFLVLRKLDLEV